MVNPITQQIVGTLQNMKTEVTCNGITPEADAMWRHAMSLYKMRRDGVPLFGRVSVDMPARHVEYDVLPAFLRRQAE